MAMFAAGTTRASMPANACPARRPVFTAAARRYLGHRQRRKHVPSGTAGHHQDRFLPCETGFMPLHLLLAARTWLAFIAQRSCIRR